MTERVILTTGGTGGHIFPALAVAEELQGRHPQVRILFVGGKKGPEARLATQAGLEFVALPVQPVLGRGLRALAAGFWLLAGVAKALKVQLRFRPQVVLGFGGYAAFAQVLAAVLLRTPTAIHEQNSVPGLTNRVLGRLVKRIMVSFPDKQGWFPAAKVKIVGNPVRKAIAATGANKNKTFGKRLLVIGGSQGAVAVNSAVIEALARLLEAGVEIRHQAGQRDVQRVRQAYRELGAEARVEAFIEDMAEAYAWADLALCRAGASTVSELAVAGVPAVLIPFPYATHGHQSVNAAYLEEAGAGVRIEQKDLAGADLAGVLIDILQHPEKLGRMREQALKLGKPDAATRVAQELAALVKHKAAS